MTAGVKVAKKDKPQGRTVIGMGIKKLVRFDWAIKYLLRNKANFDILEGFLSNLLMEEIKVEEILESESNREHENRKFNRVDLKCRDGNGRNIIIEIQNQREADYLLRLLWGTSKAVVESVDLGGGYSDVVKVISISILYHSMRLDETENADFIYTGSTEMIGLHTQKPLVLHGKKVKGVVTDPITSKVLFPEYYLIYVENFPDIVKDELDEWVYFFKHGAIREDFTAPGILIASKKLDYLALGDKERRAYDDYMAYLAEERDILDTAKDEGRTEEKRNIAKNLLALGMNLDDIVKVTELSLEEVERMSQGKK